MCGAATFLTQDNLQTLISDFRVAKVNVNHDLRPNYNLRPMQSALLIREIEGQRVLQEAQWWLVPQFEPEPKTKLTTFNARSEKLMHGMFKRYFLRSRALFIVDSYFEWQKVGGERLPHRFIVDRGKHFALAGLYSLWTDRHGTTELPTCAVITTSANKLSAPIYDRMPAILDESQYDDWLNAEVRDSSELLPMLTPFPPDRMTAYRVSTFVSLANNNLPLCVEPLEEFPQLAIG